MGLQKVNFDEGEQKVHRCFMKGFGLLTVQLLFFKISTEGDMTQYMGNMFQYFTTRAEMHSSFIKDGLVLAVICRCALGDRLGVGGGRTQAG